MIQNQGYFACELKSRFLQRHMRNKNCPGVWSRYIAFERDMADLDSQFAHSLTKHFFFFWVDGHCCQCPPFGLDMYNLWEGYSLSSRKRTPSVREKSVRNWSWPLTRMVLVGGHQMKWPITGACQANNKYWKYTKKFIAPWLYSATIVAITKY